MIPVLITTNLQSDSSDTRRQCIVRCQDDTELAMLGALIGRTSRKEGLTVKGLSLDIKEQIVSSVYDFAGFRVLF